MKKLLLILFLFWGSIGVVNAQNDPPQQQPPVDEAKQTEKLQALYVAYITKELNLTTDEAQKFWPVHTEFDKEIKAVKQDLPELDKQQAVLNIKKKYQERFTRIINADRTERFFRKDGEFRRKLIERLRKMRQNRPGPRPGLRRA